jgi:hypothetical protein
MEMNSAVGKEITLLCLDSFLIAFQHKQIPNDLIQSMGLLKTIFKCFSLSDLDLLKKTLDIMNEITFDEDITKLVISLGIF